MKPLVVVIPHQLGRAEAKRRLASGFGQLKELFRDKIGAVDDRWTDDHLDISATVLGQSVAAGVDVGDDHVRVEAKLPWLLALAAEKAKGYIEREGSKLLLEKK